MPDQKVFVHPKISHTNSYNTNLFIDLRALILGDALILAPISNSPQSIYSLYNLSNRLLFHKVDHFQLCHLVPPIPIVYNDINSWHVA